MVTNITGMTYAKKPRRYLAWFNVVVRLWFGTTFFTGKTEIIFVPGRVDSKNYQEMMAAKLVPLGPVLEDLNWVYQQDNASVHRSKSIMSHF